MDFDVLKEKWTEHDRKIDVSISLKRQFMRTSKMKRVQVPLLRFALFAGLGTLVGLIGLVILGQFIFEHWSEPRFALPAAVLDVWLIAHVAASSRIAAMALRIDYDKPVIVIQKQLDSLRVLRIRITQWALLTGQVVWWIPFLIVALKGFWNVDACKLFGAVLLQANVAAGLAIIPLAIWASRKFEDRLGGSPKIQWLMREVAGYNLNAAAGNLAKVFEFESETRDS